MYHCHDFESLNGKNDHLFISLYLKTCTAEQAERLANLVLSTKWLHKLLWPVQAVDINDRTAFYNVLQGHGNELVAKLDEPVRLA